MTGRHRVAHATAEGSTHHDAGDKAHALAPPRYGIDFVDRGIGGWKMPTQPSARPPATGNAGRVVQRVKKLALFGGALATLFTLGLVWLSPGFRRFMSDAWHDDDYRRKLVDNDFRITAGLKEYEAAFGSGFREAITGLAEDERWLDGGAGVGQAISDYYDQGGKGQTTALGFAKPDSPVVDVLEKRRDFKYLSGKYLSEFDDETELLGGATKFSVITDFNGVLSYTRTLSQDLQKYLDNLKKGGKLYTFFYATINDGEVSVGEWLSRIDGAKVTALKGGSLEIVKTENIAVVPELKLVSHEKASASNIPDRRYRLA